MASRNLVMALCATAYVGVIGFSVADLLRDPPLKTYVIVPGDDWTQCVEIRATSERLARQAVLRGPASVRAAEDCLVRPAIAAVDSRLVFERGFNAVLAVTAILAALWIGFAATRAWRQDAGAPV
ncbi:hypothetical protein [Caulobacter segnis]